MLAARNTLIEKNTVVPVHGDCLDNQSIDQAKQKEVNQTHGHGLISSDLSFNSDPVTHCHCYSCFRKINRLTICSISMIQSDGRGDFLNNYLFCKVNIRHHEIETCPQMGYQNNNYHYFLMNLSRIF